MAGVELEINVNGNMHSFVTNGQGLINHVVQDRAYLGMVIDYTSKKDGFISANGQLPITHDGSNQALEVAQSMSPNLGADQVYRLVMSWGPTPSDLDLHLNEMGSSNCQLDYSNKRCSSGKGICCLGGGYLHFASVFVGDLLLCA